MQIDFFFKYRGDMDDLIKMVLFCIVIEGINHPVKVCLHFFILQE